MSFDPDALREIDDRSTDAFVLTRRVLNDPEEMLRALLAPAQSESLESSNERVLKAAG